MTVNCYIQKVFVHLERHYTICISSMVWSYGAAKDLLSVVNWQLMCQVELCIACSGEYFFDHFETKIRSLAQFLTELLQILLLDTCTMKNNTF